MRKHILLTGLLCGLLCLVLTGCGGEKNTASYDPEAVTAALVASSAFSEDLERLDTDIAFQLLGFDRWAESPEKAGELVAYYSTGATSEIAAAFRTDGGKETLDKAEESAKQWLARQKEVLADYQPQEIAKLNDAILERKGNSLLLVVAADRAAAEAVLQGR